ncbi:putative type I inositol 1-4-5-trisphosphate 5-phosphatase [Scophthalmus maximus]|uniref:Putative type I inositol 1-4-5-trisphosphate 5-phosphatase n=1 Tax=Scophthalmus maximus TaxID=52904 RepID=A0A2U9CHQ0_SCOMX|nr:putative type I inositol 1-4-5-trisphosphate 5-phosphatase [Scophthalmus maximus]
MAGKLTAAQGTGILLVTANVGSLFEDKKNMPSSLFDTVSIADSTDLTTSEVAILVADNYASGALFSLVRKSFLRRNTF